MALTPGHSVFYALVTAASPLTSALGVLRRLTCLLQPVLLALLHPSVPGQEAGFLQARAAVRVDEDQCPGDPQPQRAGLAGDTAAGDPGDHVELVISTERDEWLTDELLMELVREVLVQRPVVDLPLPGARQDTDPGNRLLAAAGAQALPRHARLARPGAGRPARRDIARLGGVFRHVLPGAVFGLGACSRCGNLRVSGLSHGVFLVLPCRLWLLRASAARIGLLGDLDDLERHRLLCLVRMLRPGVHLELAQHLPAQRVLREHSLDGLLDHPLRVLG